MTIPALPADNANWKAWGTAIDAEARTIADKQTLVAAPTGVTATDTAVLQAAINAGGVAQLRAGTYVVSTLQIKTGSTLRGMGIGVTTVKLANGTNADLITVPNFATLTGSNGDGVETRFAIENLTLDGNGANQTGTSWTFRVYGYNYRINNVEFYNGLSGNAYSEWGSNPGLNMEAVWHRFKMWNPVGLNAVNLDWNGPHDSIFTSGEIVTGALTMHQTGIWTHGNSGGEVFDGVHTWGFHDYGWLLDHSAQAVNCEAEGAILANVLMRAGGIRWEGRVFGTNGFNPAEVGVQIGDATHTNIKRCSVDIDTFNWVSGTFALNFAASGGGNRFRGTAVLGTSTALYTGALNPSDNLDILNQDGTTDQSKIQIPNPVNIRSSSTTAFQVSNMVWDAQNHHLSVRGGGQIRGYKSDLTTQTFNLNQANGAVTPGTISGLGSEIYSGTGAPTFSSTAGAYYLRKDTPGTPGQRIYVNTASGVNWVAVDTAAGAGADVQVFTASGTWTKPSGAAAVSVLCIGPGGGGASGARFASGQVPTGGGGGGGGGLSSMEFPGSTLPATVTVTVGSTGVGGVAQTVDSTAGIAPTAGSATTFGSFLQAGRGGGGSPGGNGTAGSGAGGGGGVTNGGSGAGSLATGLAPSAAVASQGIPGGGAGGGITAAGVAANGSAGAASSTSVLTAGAGGTVGAGQAGGVGASSTVDSWGSGGGGGAANTTAAAGLGGNGGSYGAGGGGGGASLNGFASGKGGDGGPGICVVITKF